MSTTMFYAQMLKRVAGIIFLGTPHRGSRLAVLADRLFKLRRIYKIGVFPQKFVKSLRQDSSELSVRMFAVVASIKLTVL